MKKYEITARGEDCVKQTKVIFANSKEEAKQIGWELFPEYESIYVTEIEE